MAQRNGAHIDESDDERNCVNEGNGDVKEEEDEFTTYFTDNRVDIPESDTVSCPETVMCHHPVRTSTDTMSNS